MTTARQISPADVAQTVATCYLTGIAPSAGQRTTAQRNATTWDDGDAEMNELPEPFWNALHAWRAALDACDRAQSVEEGEAAFREAAAAAKAVEREVAALTSGGPTEGQT